MHELGNLCVSQNEIYTKVNKNRRSYRVYNMILLIPMPDMFPVMYFMGNGSEELSKSYIEDLLIREKDCYEVLTIHQEALENLGLSVDEVCSFMNYFINSPSLLEVPNLSEMSDRVVKEIARKLMAEGW